MATEREIAIKTFLHAHGWEKANRNRIPGDASFRGYERLELDGKKAILMDAPPSHEDVRPFVKIDHYLRALHLNAPEIKAQDDTNGFLLLEDFGNDSFTKILNGQSPLSAQYTEKELYKSAVDILVQLQQARMFPENIPPYDEAVLQREVLLLIEWYLPFIGLYNEATLNELKEEFIALWKKLYPIATEGKRVTILRDYHADNLMWLPERDSVQKVGLLDFQDALIGSPAYDLVSLLEDARRDVSPQTQTEMIDYFIKQSDQKDSDAFKKAYATLGAQRNSKIVGIFCRLAIRDGKIRYLSYLPRVWAHLENDLAHPALEELKQWMDRVIPPSKRNKESIILPEQEAANA